MEKPWLLFEAGGLAKSLDDGCVIPLLVDIDASEVTGPLTQFQCQKLDKNGMWSVIESINRKLTTPVSNDRLRKAFEVFWPELESTRRQLLEESASTATEENDGLAQTTKSELAAVATEQILSRLATIETLIVSQSGATETKGIVVTTGRSNGNEVHVTWLRDLLLVLEKFQSELGVREYQLELRGGTHSPAYTQVQNESLLADELHAFLEKRLSQLRDSTQG